VLGDDFRCTQGKNDQTTGKSWRWSTTFRTQAYTPVLLA